MSEAGVVKYEEVIKRLRAGKSFIIEEKPTKIMEEGSSHMPDYGSEDRDQMALIMDGFQNLNITTVLRRRIPCLRLYHKDYSVSHNNFSYLES